MKKLLMAFAVVGMISAASCKKSKEEPVKIETTTTTVEESADNTVTVVEEKVEEVLIDIPSFKNEDVQKAAEEYMAFAREVASAKKAGDNDKLAELQKIGAEWPQKVAEITQKLTEEDNKTWQEWTKKVNEMIND